jgi:hypothetical protein
MNGKSIRLIPLVLALLFGGAAFLRAAEPAKEDAAFAAKLFAALEKSDYAAFVADGDGPFKQLKKEQFELLTAALAPKLLAGHEVTYLGDLKQKGFRVSLWRVTFRSGGDDALATLSVKDGKVGGFFIR